MLNSAICMLLTWSAAMLPALPTIPRGRTDWCLLVYTLYSLITGLRLLLPGPGLDPLTAELGCKAAVCQQRDIRRILQQIAISLQSTP